MSDSALYRNNTWGGWIAGNMGGNVEVSPPFVKKSNNTVVADYKYGVVVIVGKHDAGLKMSDECRKFFERQTAQTGGNILQFDYRGLRCAHADESVTFVPVGDDFKVLVQSINPALDLLRSNPDELIAYFAGVKCSDILAFYDGPLATLRDRYKARLAKIKTDLEGTFGKSRVIEMPVTSLIPIPGVGDMYPVPNPVNMLVIRQQGEGTHVFVAKQWCVPFENAVKDVLKNQVGLQDSQIHFVDDLEPHLSKGEVHCATNTRRDVPPR